MDRPRRRGPASSPARPGSSGTSTTAAPSTSSIRRAFFDVADQRDVVEGAVVEERPAAQDLAAGVGRRRPERARNPSPGRRGSRSRRRSRPSGSGRTRRTRRACMICTRSRCGGRRCPGVDRERAGHVEARVAGDAHVVVVAVEAEGLAAVAGCEGGVPLERAVGAGDRIDARRRPPATRARAWRPGPQARDPSSAPATAKSANRIACDLLSTRQSYPRVDRRSTFRKIARGARFSRTIAAVQASTPRSDSARIPIRLPGGAAPRLPRVVEWLAALGVAPEDSPQERLRKASLTLANCLIATMAIAWVATYWSLGLLALRRDPVRLPARHGRDADRVRPNTQLRPVSRGAAVDDARASVPAPGEPRRLRAVERRRPLGCHRADRSAGRRQPAPRDAVVHRVRRRGRVPRTRQLAAQRRGARADGRRRDVLRPQRRRRFDDHVPAAALLHRRARPHPERARGRADALGAVAAERPAGADRDAAEGASRA